MKRLNFKDLLNLSDEKIEEIQEELEKLHKKTYIGKLKKRKRGFKR